MGEDEEGEEQEDREGGKNHGGTLGGGVEDGGKKGTGAALSSCAPFSQFSLRPPNLNTFWFVTDRQTCLASRNPCHSACHSARHSAIIKTQLNNV